MKSIKTILLGTTLAAGLGLFLGTDANAESLYTVKAGDTLSTISHQFAGDNSLIQKIASDNKLPNLDLIFEGEQLVIRSEKEVANTPAPAVEVAPVQQVVEQPVAQPVQQEEFTKEVIYTPDGWIASQTCCSRSSATSSTCRKQ